MDWKLFATTFAAIFVAEIGDKTQLATVAFAGGGSSRWVVFAGASLALVATTAIAVLGGAVLVRYVPPEWIKRGAGTIFVAIGLVFLLTARSDREPDPPAPAPAVETTPASAPEP